MLGRGPMIATLVWLALPGCTSDDSSAADEGTTSGETSGSSGTTTTSPADGDSSEADVSGDDRASEDDVDPDDDTAGTDESTGDTGGPEPTSSGIYPLDGLDPQLPYDDLAPLDAIVGDATFVGLGESTHTAAAFLAGKARLTRYLIEERGYRVIGLETPWYSMRDIGTYLEQCDGPADDTVVGSMFAVWADSNMVALVDWLCTWNAEHADDPVSFIGWDLQQPWHDGALVLAAMEAVDPSAIETIYSAVDGGGVDACNGVGLANFNAYVESSDADVWSGSPPDEQAHAQCLEALPELQAWIDSNEAALLAALSADELFWLRIAARGIAAWEDSAYYFSSDSVLSFEARDLANAQTILDIQAAQYPDDKMILWAHNAHLLRDTNSLTGGLGLGGATMTGTSLATQLGDDYKAIGLIGYDIDLTWFTPYDAPPADGETSVELALHALGEDYLLVDLHPQDDPFFPAGELFDLGHPIQGIDTMIPAEQFDALVFADQSPGMTPAWR